jgi:hypothetical protein
MGPITLGCYLSGLLSDKRLSHFFQEDGHGVCGYHRQKQTVQSAVMWAYGSKGVRIFTNDLQAHFRPDALGSPATSWVINPAKTRLYLKHQSELPP